ncbi:MAG: MoaD/ThiS family protein [Tepidanaerobacteraceae bacterium]
MQKYANTEDGKVYIKLSEGTSVRQLLNNFGVVPGEVGLILLNSRIVAQDVILKDKGILELYPIFGGG